MIEHASDPRTADLSAPPVEPGAQLPEWHLDPLSMTDIVQYQGASGDLNPMHHDDGLARSAGYPEAFSVGMLGAGWLATYCTRFYGEESVRRFRTRFRGLVFRGERLVAAGEVVRLFAHDGERRVELSLSLRNSAGVVVVDGTAEFAVQTQPPGS